jgi:hypothetical protein
MMWRRSSVRWTLEAPDVSRKKKRLAAGRGEALCNHGFTSRMPPTALRLSVQVLPGLN